MSFAARTPTLSRAALWCATRLAMITGHRLHWRALQVATKIDYRAPVMARLANGMKCRVPWIDDAGRMTHETGCYEPDSVLTLTSILKKGDTFLDIGASFGQYALLASKIVGDTGRVVAFEPDPVSFSWLADNVRRNRLTNVVIEPIALGEQNGTLDLYIGSPQNLGTTSFRQQYNFSGRRVRVPVCSLDEYCEAHGVTCVNAIKLDVEGAELLVLRGASNVLAMRPTFIVEFEESNQQRFGFSCAQLERLLAACGYQLYGIGSHGAIAPYADHDVRMMPTRNVLARPR